MSNIFEFNGFKPVIHKSAYIHPNATVTGNVIIGKDVYIGPAAAIRGDWDLYCNNPGDIFPRYKIW